MRVLKPFLPLYDDAVHDVIVNTPRASAKSFGVAQLCAHLVTYVCGEANPRDIVVFRANSNSLAASVMTEIEDQLVEFGAEYRTRTAPLRIEVCGCNIYFLGVSGHDRSRVRGFHPKHKLIAIVGDECQQITSEENLKHALATFRRYLDDTAPYKVVLCGNPHEVKAHWWNTYAATYSKVRTSIKSTWRDLHAAGVLPKATLDDILLEKRINPGVYRFMFEGDLSGMSGGAYPSFDRSRHLITPEQAREIFAGERIECVIWGGDGAITHDATAICPIAVMSSGRAAVLERFFFDPIKHGRPLAPSELADLIDRYVDEMDRKYRITTDGVCTSLFVIDGAAEDLITQLRYTLPPVHDIKAYTTKNIIRNNSAVNNVFARNMVYIIDYGGYFDYAAGRFVPCPDPLAEQLESVVWKGAKYDPSIPNDLSDALTYGAALYYENPENLYLPERMAYYEHRY